MTCYNLQYATDNIIASTPAGYGNRSFGNQVNMDDLASREACSPDAAIDEGVCREAWFAIQTVYKHEFRVLRDLTAKGFTAYLPVLRETRQWTDRTKIIELPAFSSYLFLRHDASLRSRSRILDTFGVARMLPDNHKPSPIADVEIESVRRALDSKIPCARCEPPAIGTRVRVVRGVLAGVDGQIARINNKDRLVILIASISQAISVEVDMNDVEVIAELTPGSSSTNSQVWHPNAPTLSTI
jgi:transcription antitermination factor NusG